MSLRSALRGLAPYGALLGCLALPTGWAQTPASSTAAPTPSTTPSAAPAADTTAARAQAVDGTVFITRPDGRRSTLARGSALNVGDTLNTTSNSTARLRFTDGGETVMRPDSSLQVQAYRYGSEKPEDDSLVLRLLRGGLRALSGQVNKRGNPGAYQLNVATATIGIRGTDFSVRLCDVDCAVTTAAVTTGPGATTTSNAGPPVVARVVQQQGEVTVQRNSRDLPLASGAPLYAGDQLESSQGAYAVVVFRDNTRVTLNGASAIALTQYSYNPRDPSRNSFLLHLVRGGLRAVTGLIGKTNPRAFHMQTATATVGVRGTVFDLMCGGTYDSSAPASPSEAAPDCDHSLYALTREGEIGLATGSGAELGVPAGQSAVAADAAGGTQALATVPPYFSNLTTPAPEGVSVDMEQLFGSEPPQTSDANGANGVFLLVHEGQVTLGQAGAAVTVDAGESAYAGMSSVPQRLYSSPAVLDRDPFLSDRMLNNNLCRR